VTASLQGNPFNALTEYDLRNLGAHLEGAGDAGRIHRLLELETDAGRNAWYEAQIALGDSVTYAADVARAWEAAERDGEIGLQVRYALLTTTLSTHAVNVPPELAVAALAQGVWSGRRTLTFVRQLRDAATRATALSAIAPHLDAALLAEAIADLVGALTAAAREGSPEVLSALPEQLPAPVLDALTPLAGSLTDPAARAHALADLAPRLAGAAQAHAQSQALEAARETPAGHARALAYSAVVHVLDEPLRREAATEALASARHKVVGDNPAARQQALIAIAPFLPEQELGTALRVARSFEGWQARVAVVSALASELPEPLLADAVERGRKARTKQERVTLLAELANRCAGQASRELRDEALAAARATPAHQGRATALAAVAVRLPQSDREPVADEALAVVPRDPLGGEDVLVQLAPCLSERQLEAALALARALEEPLQRTNALSALWPHLPPRLRRSALRSRLAAARAETYEPFRIDALAELLPLLSPAARLRAAREALEAVRSLESGEFRASHLAKLAPHLPPDVLREAIDAAQAIDDHEPRALLLVELATAGAVPPDGTFDDALAVARRQRNARDRMALIGELVPLLPARLLEEALAALTADGSDDSGTAEVLQALAPRLPAALLPAALDRAVAIEYLDARAAALATLGPYLPPELLDRAVEAARAIPPGAHIDGRHGGGRDHRADALAALAPHLREASSVAREALTAAHATRWAPARAEALADMLPHLPSELQPEAVRAALAALAEADMRDDHAARVLSALAASGDPDVLTASKELADPVWRARALLGQSVNLALEAAREVGPGSLDDEVAEVSLLVDLADHAPEGERAAVVHDALEVVLASESPAYRFAAGPGRLVPLLARADRERVLDRALAEARSWPDSRAKADALFAIGRLLTGPAQVDALRGAVDLALTETTERTVEGLRERLPGLEDVPRDVSDDVWRFALRRRAADDRPLFLRRLRELVPLLSAVGGEASVVAAGDAVATVTGWWP
jgi:hypothetical protein